MRAVALFLIVISLTVLSVRLNEINTTLQELVEVARK